jgi:hypothetical protein
MSLERNIESLRAAAVAAELAGINALPVDTQAIIHLVDDYVEMDEQNDELLSASTLLRESIAARLDHEAQGWISDEGREAISAMAALIRKVVA